MSGGHWGYKNDYMAHEIFSWNMSPDYGKEGFDQAKYARKLNPLEDKQLSEMLWDMLCLLHSYDWYASGDTCEDTYRKDVAHFKKKWLNRSTEELVCVEIDKALSEAREDLLQIFGGEEK